MSTLPVNNRLLGGQLVLGAVLTATVVVVQFTPLNDMKTKVRSQYVTTGLLDYGEKGKIIKSLGLVYGAREDGSQFTPYVPDSGRTNLFRKKRERGEYVYRANPGSGFQLPSTLAVDVDAFRNNWPLASLVIDQAALTDPLSGIAVNPHPRGRLWERRATFSLFQNDELVVAANTGVRIHGGDRERALAQGGLDQSYRLYLRNYYGADSVASNLIFNKGDSSVKRLVFRRACLFIQDLAMDIAERMGALVPLHTPAILYLNGSNMGVHSLQEHVGRRQWELRLGHDDLFFVRHKGTTDEASANSYRELSDWLRDNADEISIETASQRIDIPNLTRNLFVMMFCGSNDRFEEAAVLDRSAAQPGWQWITWELADCIERRWTVTGKDDPWTQPALRQVVAWNRQMRSWEPTYRSLRSDLFAALLNNGPDFVNYFLRTVTDVLNHEVTPGFLERLYDHYDRLLESYRDPLAEDGLADFQAVGGYLRHRPDFVRDDIRRAFSLENVYAVNVALPPERPYTVDGYAKHGGYAGRYFPGQVVKLSLPDADAPESGAWTVNSERVTGNPVRVPVAADMVIQLDRAGGDD